MSIRRIPPKTGNWHLDIYVPHPQRPGEQKRIIRSLKTQDRREAEARYYDLARDLHADANAKRPTSVTLKDLQARIMDWYGNAPEGTWRGFKNAFDSFFSVHPQSTPLEQIRRTHIDEWRARAQNTLASSTINKYSDALKTAYEKGVEWEMVQKNPFARLAKLKETPQGRLYWTEEEVGAILTALRKNKHARRRTYLHPAASVCLYAGLRLSEVIHLRADHIQGDELRIEMPTKNRRFRVVPISSACRAALDEALERHEENGIIFFSEKKPSGYMNRHTLNQAFKMVLNDIGIPGHWHMLRHTFAARLLSAGVPILSVSRWLGHASVTITEGYYGHLLPGAQSHLIEAAVLERSKD